MEGSLNKVILHSAVGAGVAAAKGEDVLAGAASGAVAELARPLTDGQDKIIQSTVSSVIGGITAGAVGGDASVNVGSYIGQTSDQFNRQLHEDERQLINEKAQKFADENHMSLEEAQNILYLGAMYYNNQDSAVLIDKILQFNSDTNENSKYTLQNINSAFSFLQQESQGMQFVAATIDGSSTPTIFQDYFTSTQSQYENNGLNMPVNMGAMQDVSVQTLLPMVQIGGTVLKTTSPLVKSIGYQADSLYLNAGIKTDSYIQNTVVPGMKEGYYGTMNYLYDPKTITVGEIGLDILNGAISPEPPTTGWQGLGAGVMKIYDTTEEYFKER